MDWLLFTLAAPMASFGGVAVGEVRGSDAWPSRSALLGLLGAALGVRRTDKTPLAELAGAVQFAVRVEQAGDRLLDYHTVQAPKRAAIKGRPHRTRRDELSVPKSGLNTVLSERAYQCDFRATVAACVGEPWSANGLRDALLRPRFVLYLGRRCNPLAWPLAPQVIEAEDLSSALTRYDDCRNDEQSQWRDSGPRSGLWWPWRTSRTWWLDVEAGLEERARTALAQGTVRSVLRRDQPVDRSQWLFVDHAHLRMQGGSL